jgi:hypothetical protein
MLAPVATPQKMLQSSCIAKATNALIMIEMFVVTRWPNVIPSNVELAQSTILAVY